MSTQTFDPLKHPRDADGTFAKKGYAEAADVSLDDYFNVAGEEWYPGDDAVGAVRQPEPDPAPVTAPPGAVSLRAYLTDFNNNTALRALAQKSLASMNRKGTLSTDYTSDDVMQGCLVRLYERMEREEDKDIFVRTPAAFLRRALNAEVTSLYRKQYNRSGEDDQATRVLNERINDYMAEHGRRPSTALVDAMAKDIRENWKDQRHKPHENFHRRSREHVSLDAQTDDGNTVQEFSTALRHEDHYDVDEHNPHVSKVTEAIHAEGLEGKARITDANVRAGAWRMMAHRHGAPDPTPNSLSVESASAHCAALGLGRGSTGPSHVTTALNEYDHGEDNARTRALLAPFGNDLTAKQEESVVRTLRESGQYADDLYATAVAMATRKS